MAAAAPAPKAKAAEKPAAPAAKVTKKEAPTAAKEEAPAKEAAPAKEEAPKAVAEADDLKKIEGIGPKIAEVLGEAGVTTYAQLAGMERDAIKTILDTVATLKSKEPKTWPQQAQLAADGKWDELKTLQDELMGGL
ncbi:helix-hairpin-helix domain-containing protein [uncultured Cocleimonas sp.]|uniref:helix-hairpin-helix domain-containing protein n=1 Tax=uncultured Cocleimonas sp. TaxID=1051587 RepID=UPI00262FE21F|nr:helix-hairpin-helix domain-containing protein [uncultured Cocleimonas sp.]